VTFEIVYSRKAGRQLEKLSPQTALRILEGCERLKKNPFPDEKHIKKLKGYKGLYRQRIGDYRVVYRISGATIGVIDVVSKPDFQKAY
jgi:mRNA interferase RelE/StbE